MTAAHQLEASFDQAASYLELALSMGQRRMQTRRTSKVSLDTPLSALPQFVQEATRKLFAALDGAKIPQATIESVF
jgi:hypothetical protein